MCVSPPTLPTHENIYESDNSCDESDESDEEPPTCCGCGEGGVHLTTWTAVTCSMCGHDRAGMKVRGEWLVGENMVCDECIQIGQCDKCLDPDR
jgi:hypothetical protein